MTDVGKRVAEIGHCLDRLEESLSSALEGMERQVAQDSQEANKLEVVRVRLDRIQKELVALRYDFDAMNESTLSGPVVGGSQTSVLEEEGVTDPDGSTIARLAIHMERESHRRAGRLNSVPQLLLLESDWR